MRNFLTTFGARPASHHEQRGRQAHEREQKGGKGDALRPVRRELTNRRRQAARTNHAKGYRDQTSVKDHRQEKSPSLQIGNSLYIVTFGQAHGVLVHATKIVYPRRGTPSTAPNVSATNSATGSGCFVTR